MAHTYGGGGRLPASGNSTTSNPATVSLNLPAGTTVLWVSIVVAGTTARAGGDPTFNGVALTAGNAKANAGGTPETCSEDWYILDPPTGANYTLSIPNSGTRAMAIAYGYASASAGNTSVYDNKVSTGGSSTNPSTSFTVQDGAIWFGGVGDGATTWNPSGRSGTQINDWDAGSWGRGAQYGVKSGTGSQTVSWTFGTSEDWIIQAISFKEQLAPITGTGALSAGSGASEGDGVSLSTGTGSPDAQSATASGSGVSSSTGSGSPDAQSATVDGAGQIESGVSGEGSPDSQAAAVSGSGVTSTTGSGALSAAVSQADGEGVSASVGSAPLQVGTATVIGSGISGSVGEGALQSENAHAQGSSDSVVINMATYRRSRSAMRAAYRRR